MKVVQIKEAGQRDACLARLCAEVYGQAAGLTPLVVFTGTRNVLFKQEVARLLAGVDNTGKPLALALLVLDEAGEGMTITHACGLESDGAKQRLISELTLKAPLRVEVDSPEQQAFYQGCGIKRWFKADNGAHIGLSGRHPAGGIAELAATVALDEALILRRFKHDAKAFEVAKQDFLSGLKAFPSSIKA
ncbi:hypothetical protein B0H98_107147 [Vreelandella songnenensis]|uniref:Uncharacterized protein n=1 Tax=Vreelandella songnenensis TaxID=1176243 RepID=A0A2T0V1E5_9GAMM|nr:hypothetical protein [Halomonas songnenensis]PRY64002.1 hypothetical protein B0H98_107147 [Halomonas songnenensis]